MAVSRRAILRIASIVSLALSFVSWPILARTRSSARLLHTEPSDFAPIVVFEQYGERCMNFVSIQTPGRHTCYELDDPDKLVFEYTRMMASALLAKPDPESVLIIGLGGASLQTALHKVLPDTVIDSVEIDPAVVRVAKQFFGYKTGPNQRVFVQDGREFVEQARKDGKRYDIVMLDAFDADYIPAHLMTVEFLQQMREILTPTGIVVANTLTRSKVYKRESATYGAVFGDFYNLRTRLGGNRVIIAAAGELPTHKELRRNAKALAQRLKPIGVNTGTALKRFDRHQASETSAKPLHDTSH